MSKLGKMRKNIEKYKINEYYNNMTPEQYREGIRNAIKVTTDKLSYEYNNEINRIRDEANRKISETVEMSTEIISVELLYELAVQMECFVENPEHLDEKIDKIQEIYINTLSMIDEYSKCEKSEDARNKFKHKKDILKKMFRITF